jgi:hypothetical protein
MQSIDCVAVKYSRQAGSTESTMLVVSDMDNIFLPKPMDLLLNLSECKTGLEALLGRIPRKPYSRSWARHASRVQIDGAQVGNDI